MKLIKFVRPAALRAIAMAIPLTVWMVPFNIHAQESRIPSFSQYRVPVSKAKPKPVRINTKNARMFRTRLRNGNKGHVNFAGHFIVVSWGCGTSCMQGAIIDTRTGRVYFPNELFEGFGIHSGESEAFSKEYGFFEFRPDSKLMALNGWGGSKEGVRFLVWEGNRFRLEKFIPLEPGTGSGIDANHLAELNEWLAVNNAWRLASTGDYDPKLMQFAKTDLGEDFTPYYVTGDFNGDSHDDFAVILVGTSAALQFGAAVFNGPFGAGKQPTPAFFTDKLQRGDALFFNDKLVIGPYASDNIFFLNPDGKGYKVEMPEFGR